MSESLTRRTGFWFSSTISAAKIKQKLHIFKKRLMLVTCEDPNSNRSGHKLPLRLYWDTSDHHID